MKTSLTYDEKKGTFTVLDGDKVVGTLDWTWTPSFEVSLDHTNVEEDARGTGVGEKLMDAVAQFARENALKVIPNCSYAKKVFEESPSIQDVLAKN